MRAVAKEWFARYVMTLITPVLWLDAEHGVALAAHQRNTLIQLDAAGYPGAGWYRGSQGLAYRASRMEHLGRLPSYQPMTPLPARIRVAR